MQLQLKWTRKKKKIDQNRLVALCWRHVGSPTSKIWCRITSIFPWRVQREQPCVNVRALARVLKRDRTGRFCLLRAQISSSVPAWTQRICISSGCGETARGFFFRATFFCDSCILTWEDVHLGWLVNQVEHKLLLLLLFFKSNTACMSKG